MRALHKLQNLPLWTLLALLPLTGCSTDDGASDPAGTTDSGTTQYGSDAEPGDLGSDPITPPAPACDAVEGGGSATVAAPELIATLSDRWHEAWLGSPAVADLDGDDTPEVLVPRGNLLLGWHLDGSIVFRAETEGGRIWASPVVADLIPGGNLEVAAASRENLYVWDSDGTVAPGFPVTWRDEIRTLAAGDIDGDGRLELVVVTSNRLEANGQRDIIMAYETDGSPVPGFPPNTTGASGCDDACYVTGGFDQNLAIGDVDGDDVPDILAPHDNAYISLHRGNGEAFSANSIFENRTRFSGIRMLHDYSLAQQGWADDEETANQAHFTNSAPAIADIDGDGTNEIVVLASVQNAAQSDRFRGVALWVLRNDGSRPDDWLEPVHFPGYLAGLWDFEGTNVVGATNQVSVVELDPDRAGPEIVFAGFDGQIHCVDARGEALWSHVYTSSERVLTGGVAVADLSGDGSPEIVFNTYSPDADLSELVILDAGGNRLHVVTLPDRGAMPVPTIADADGDGTLDIIVSLKDGEDRVRQVLVYQVPGSADNCLLWPTGRGNYLRNGFVP